MEYIEALSEAEGCFICNYIAEPERDKSNFVLWRTSKSVVVFNRFPYNNGHLLIAPMRHIERLDEATDEELLELVKLCRDCQTALGAAISPHGFNVGMNFGRRAGAGLPGHMHIHVVPRWDGDTSFMHVCSGTDVISQSMTELYELLKQISLEKKLPNL
ncbi:MAG: HIT family hydrolase [Planctomycetota bacterium]|nr:MAG: HIT family hydrolase [Planctomycetota bacterium]